MARLDTARALADASSRPYWLDRPESVGVEHDPVDADVATDLLVVGAGFTGLWAAIEAGRDGLDVLVVDARSVAGGASGRCGGFVNASITHGIPNGHGRWPDEMSSMVAIQEALWNDTLQLLDDHGAGDAIEANGKLTVATRPHHQDMLDESVAILRRYGQVVDRLDEGAVRGFADSPTYLGGYHLRSANGICDPTRLALALAGIAEERGARIAGRTSIASLDDRGDHVLARCESGAKITAKRVLLATNAYTPLLRRLRAYVIPVYDHVIVTEPLTTDLWNEIGWRQRVGITDAGNQFHYYRPTPDGRILFGGWDATYHRGGTVDDRLESNSPTHQILVDHLVQTFPALHETRVTHAWGGPVDSTSRFTATMHTAWGGKVGWAIGFTGLGVGASRFGALAALDLLADRKTERTRLSMVRKQPVPFPPEPLRYPLIAMTKRALLTEDRTGRRGLWLRLLDRFGVGFDT